MSFFAQSINCWYTLEPSQYQQSTFEGKNKKIMFTTENPNFTIQKWVVMGSTLYGNVSMMRAANLANRLASVMYGGYIHQ